MNKRANVLLIIFIALSLLVLLIMGIFLAVGTSLITYTTDLIAPEISNLGMVGDANMTEIADYSITPAHTIINQLKWFSSFIFVMGFVALLVLAFIFKSSGTNWALPFYVMLTLLLVIAGMVFSNMYEELYDDDSFLGDGLQQQSLISFLIIYSPIVVLVFSVVVGIIFFSGAEGPSVI